MSIEGMETKEAFDFADAECYGYYDKRFSECSEICRLGTFCKQVTEAWNSGKITYDEIKKPSVKEVESSESIDVDPFDHFIELLKSKAEVSSSKKTSEKADVLDVRIGRKLILVVWKSKSSGAVSLQTAKSTERVDLSSIDAANNAYSKVDGLLN